ncbi:hypothetical protein ACEQ6C_38475, partial [Rhizobium ruizarguesonis]
MMENAVTGQRYLAWEKGEGYSFSKDRAGEGGSHGTGVPAGHGGKTSGKDTSHRKPVPKAANGQDGYSNNQSSGNEKRGTEGMGQGANVVSPKTVISPEMEAKILEGQRKAPKN